MLISHNLLDLFYHKLTMKMACVVMDHLKIFHIPLESTCMDHHTVRLLYVYLSSLFIGIVSSYMPPLDLIDKSVDLSYLVPPKFISGSLLNMSNCARLIPRLNDLGDIRADTCLFED